MVGKIFKFLFEEFDVNSTHSIHEEISRIVADSLDLEEGKVVTREREDMDERLAFVIEIATPHRQTYQCFLYWNNDDHETIVISMANSSGFERIPIDPAIFPPNPDGSPQLPLIGGVSLESELRTNEALVDQFLQLFAERGVQKLGEMLFRHLDIWVSRAEDLSEIISKRLGYHVPGVLDYRRTEGGQEKLRIKVVTDLSIVEVIREDLKGVNYVTINLPDEARDAGFEAKWKELEEIIFREIQNNPDAMRLVNV